MSDLVNSDWMATVWPDEPRRRIMPAQAIRQGLFVQTMQRPLLQRLCAPYDLSCVAASATLKHWRKKEVRHGSDRGGRHIDRIGSGCRVWSLVQYPADEPHSRLIYQIMENGPFSAYLDTSRNA